MSLLGVPGFGRGFGSGPAPGGGDVTIVSVNGGMVEVSGNLGACSGGQPELRRHATGTHEFIGDVKGRLKLPNGHWRLSIDYGSLKTRPQHGETAYLYCSSGGGGGSTGGGSTGGGGGSTGGGGGTGGGTSSTGTTSGIPGWVLLAGIGVVAYLIFKK